MTPTSYDTELIHEFVNERIRSGRGWIAAYFVRNLENTRNPASCHSGTVVSVPDGGFICPDSIPGERKLPQYQGFWRASAYPLAASCGVAADCLCKWASICGLVVWIPDFRE